MLMRTGLKLIIMGVACALPAAEAPAQTILNYFTCQQTPQGVELDWQTGQESNTFRWLIDRAPSPDSAFHQVSATGAAGNSNFPCNYSCRDSTVIAGRTYYYNLKVSDFGGAITCFDTISVFVNGVAGDSRGTSLAGRRAGSVLSCFPNPFRDRIEIMASADEPARVSAAVYDLVGRLVARLDCTTTRPGMIRMTWNGRDQAGRRANSGMYVCRVSTGGKTVDRIICLLK
jgi:hypothetical protein